ncbi:MAG: flagellar hook capping FlgD N-terminal domain-containing protein [Halanaerobacter sp.]
MVSLQQVYQSSQDQEPLSQASEGATDTDESDEVSDAVNDSMGKDEFLNLLTTQLKNQNPLEPMDNKEFVSQMAQFSSLEQMNNMNSNMNDFLKFQKISQAGSLVGKEVEVLNSDTGQNIVGEIERANVTEDETMVTINGKQYPLANIQQIMAGE